MPTPSIRRPGTPLDDAIRSGYDDVKEFLLSKGGVVGATGAIRRGGGASDPSADLCHAAATGDVEKLRELVNVDGLDVNRGDYGVSFLYSLSFAFLVSWWPSAHTRTQHNTHARCRQKDGHTPRRERRAIRRCENTRRRTRGRSLADRPLGG